MTITATFIGNTSLGYHTGRRYHLLLDDAKKITVKRLDGTGICEYQSLSAFLINWNVILVYGNTDKGKRDELKMWLRVAQVLESIPDHFCTGENFPLYFLEINMRIKDLERELNLINKVDKLIKDENLDVPY